MQTRAEPTWTESWCSDPTPGEEETPASAGPRIAAPLCEQSLVFHFLCFSAACVYKCMLENGRVAVGITRGGKLGGGLKSRGLISEEHFQCEHVHFVRLTCHRISPEVEAEIVVGLAGPKSGEKRNFDLRQVTQGAKISHRFYCCQCHCRLSSCLFCVLLLSTY